MYQLQIPLGVLISCIAVGRLMLAGCEGAAVGVCVGWVGWHQSVWACELGIDLRRENILSDSIVCGRLYITVQPAL